MTIGQQAFSIVEAYAGMGIQRTGGAGNADTIGWLCKLLAGLGASVSLQPYPYWQFEADITVNKAGQTVEAMMLYYSARGRHEMTNPAIGHIDAHAEEANISVNIARAAERAMAGGHDGLVLATDCPSGDLCAINREHGAALNFPVILIAEHDLAGIEAGPFDVECSATTRCIEASNICARFEGPEPLSPVVVTTPISGWFRCAGERGCSVAIAIEVARRLAKNFTVDVLLATGHELGFIGGHHLAKNYAMTPRCVLHLGSCIANIDAEMMGVCSAGSAAAENIAAALQPLGIRPVTPDDPSNPGSWVGESQCWSARQRPMLSIAGQAPHFHTPGDLPGVVTTSALLETAIEAISDAALALASASGS